MQQYTRTLTMQFLRFAACGILCFLIDFGLLYALTEFTGIDYLMSSGISFSVSVIVNYLISVRWVFAVTENRSATLDLIIFIILSTIGLGLNQVIMWIATEHLGIWYMLSKIVSTAIVTVYNFITRKLFLENDRFSKKA